ncbi:MAG: monovalent cation/H+ antiporter subunit D [Burkholderiaceae bacterium]
MNWPHWTVLPVVLPLLAAALILIGARANLGLARLISLASTLALGAIALLLLAKANGGAVEAYLLGNWRAPFGIALALDRLAALMLMLTAVVALGSLIYSLDDDDSRGPHFHALFQLQLMGLNGAFLTADLFNLFVFFEVLLAASYGLLLHGGGVARMKAAFHYVSFNLVGSALFLIAVAALYGLCGTLNMADLALKVAAAPADKGTLIRAAALLLLVVFCVKAALLPLYFWLPDTYGAASAPVAALFAVMTKVGVYAIARVGTLIFGADAGVATQVASPWLPWLALATIALAGAGALAARRLRVLVAYIVILSAGTLLLGLGVADAASIEAAIFYLVPSTLVVAGLFLVVDRVAAARGEAADRIDLAPFNGGRVGLGATFFVLAMAAASLPPFAGFVAKAMLLGAVAPTPFFAASWLVVLGAGLALIIALARAGSLVFWKAPAGLYAIPSWVLVEPAQRLGIAIFTAALIAVSVGAGPLADYSRATAQQLLARDGYIGAVLGATPVAPAWQPRTGMEKP